MVRRVELGSKGSSSSVSEWEGSDGESVGEGSHGLGRNQRGLRVGCWAMVGDYIEDSSVKKNLNLLLRLTWVGPRVDLKQRRLRSLEGLLQESRMLGASTTTPGNEQLLKEFQGQGFSREHALKSSTET